MTKSACNKKRIKGDIEIFRIGNYQVNDRKRISKIKNVIVTQQKIHASDATTGTSWSPTINIKNTMNWKSGYYTINFKSTTGETDNNIASIIVKNPKLNGDILVKLSTNTYQAYNSWGGHSFYRSPHGISGGHVISFNRPTPPFFFVWEYYYIIWLEDLAKKSNIKIDYATDFDLHSNQSMSLRYPLLISVGHDEYWSQQEFMNIYNRIYKYGKNTLFLGANTAYWRIRYADINRADDENLGRELICYKYTDDPILMRSKSISNEIATGKFREKGYPETMLMGVGYEGYFKQEPYHNSYHAKNLHLPLFKGTELEKNDEIFNLIGYEWDNTDPQGDGYNLLNKKGGNRLSLIDNKSFYVLFSGKVKGKHINLIHKNRDHGIAEAVYFKTQSGAKVFSSGTIRWPWALTKKGYINKKLIKFNENLINDFLGR